MACESIRKILRSLIENLRRVPSQCRVRPDVSAGEFGEIVGTPSCLIDYRLFIALNRPLRRLQMGSCVRSSFQSERRGPRGVLYVSENVTSIYLDLTIRVESLRLRESARGCRAVS